jgi:Phosphatase
MPRISTSQARAELLAAGITGPNQSHSRRNVVGKINALLGPDPDETFGLSDLGTHSPAEVLGLVADLTGCWRDLDDCEGYDVIDPDKTMAGIVTAAERLRDEAAKGSTLLCVTGHPTGMLEHHIHVLAAYRRAGGKVLRLKEDENIHLKAGKHREIRYIGGVGVLADWGNLQHTHSALPMEKLLEDDQWPDIVLGDHGYAGAAIERGIPTIAIMDINDIALAIPAPQGKDVIIVPLDDNRVPYSYEPSWRLFEQIIEGEDL